MDAGGWDSKRHEKVLSLRMKKLTAGGQPAVILILISGGAGVLLSSAACAATVQGYVMDVQMTPAVCMFDSNRAKQRKCLQGYSLNITGLYPETSRRDCETSSSAKLSPIQAKVVARVMPDEHARVQLWQGIGGCVPMNASQYFRTIINYADRLKVPAVLTGQETTVVQQNELNRLFIRLNPGMHSKSIHFQCTSHQAKSYLTEVKICYSPNGRYKQCSSSVETQCPSAFIIKGSY